MQRIKLAIIFTFLFSYSVAQNNHKITVSFLHGSKPYREQRRIELKQTGGYYGGHVSIVYDSIEFGFTSGKWINVFPSHKNPCGIFYCEELKDFQKDTVGLRYTMIEIPIDDNQYKNLKLITESYLGRPPYDYAFFGMRCASATYDVLSQIGIVKQKSRFSNVVSNFYPKLLRTKMRIIAKKNHWRLTIHKGKKTRIWEEDDDND